MARRNSPLEIHHGRPAGAQVRDRCCKHRERMVLPAGEPSLVAPYCEGTHEASGKVQGSAAAAPG